jgi:Leucine-rich repeat (LRR) protein
MSVQRRFNKHISQVSYNFLVEISSVRSKSVSQIGTATTGTLSGLYELKDLYLYTNRIESISPKAFMELRNLVVLDLSKNRITALPRDTFSDLPALNDLNLQRNRIRVGGGGDKIRKLPWLHELNLSSKPFNCD